MGVKSNEIKVGLVVILASVGLLATLFYATGGEIFARYHEFHLGIEPGGLAPGNGDPVFMNGIKIGKVAEIRLETRIVTFGELTEAMRKAYRAQHALADVPPNDMPVPVKFVLAVTKIHEDYEIPLGTKGRIKSTITGTRLLSLEPGLTEDMLSPEETREHPLIVWQEKGLMDLGEQMSARIDEIAEAAIEALSEAKTGMVKAQATLDEANEAIVKFREKAIDSGRLESILKNVDEASASLNSAMAKIEGRVDAVTEKIQEAAADFAAVGANAGAIVEGMKGDFEEILANVKRATSRIDSIMERAAPKIDLVLEDVAKVGKNIALLSDDLKANGPTIRRTLEEAGRDLDGIMDSLSETGQNLQDATEDIRAHPWKALNKPDADVIAYENVRNAMLNYVRAMQRMDRTAGAIRDLLRVSGGDPEARALMAKSLAQFERSMERYNYFELRLMELLKENADSGR